MNANIKYLIFDLDDTLLRKNRTISDYTVKVLKKAQEEGFKVIFNTSRSKQNSKRYADLLGVDYGIYNGGCEIVDKDGNDLFSRVIPKERTKELSKYLNSVCEKISVQSRDTFYASDKDYKAQNAVWTDFTNGLEVDAYKIVCYSQDHKFIEDIANKYNLEFQNYLNGGWHRLSLKGANKWSGTMKFLELVHGSPSEVASFGDDFGDMEMISKSGIGVAMANSQKEVLAIAPYVTLSNEEDGCAKFIEENIL